jgi:hypothetical protein
MSDIVKDSETLKQAILSRMDELGLTVKQIAQDAKKRGMNGFTDRSVSVWKNHSYAKGALNQLQIIWLAYRLGIRVRLVVGEPVIEDGILKYIVPTPFDEKKAIKDFEQLFPTPPKKKKK